MNEIVLEGCTATPLAGYLKALGVLRLLSAKYPETRGAWCGDRFMLMTSLDREGIERFFLNDYAPTPIMAPWNAGSGFYFQERKSKETDPATGKKAKLGVFDQSTAASDVVDAIIQSKSRRLASYRRALAQAKDVVQRDALTTAPESGGAKDIFILSLRARLPDECVEAMDAGLAVSGGTTNYPPMLGTGWNDGNLDFTSNFMQRAIDVLGTDDAAAPEYSRAWLQNALFDVPTPGLTSDNIGQFSPGHAGGYNTSTGFGGDGLVNPWDFLLMLEGTLMLGASATRRNADNGAGAVSYPFTVRTVTAGSGSLGESDSSKDNTRGEIWTPIWMQAASCSEVLALMAEGRVALGRKPARDALDFVRAVQHLGGYRGVRGFQRFGFLKRNGRAFFATPLARIEVSEAPTSSWLNEVDDNGWLERFRRFANDANTATRFKTLRKRLEDRLFALAGKKPSKTDAQSLLILLGDIQFAIGVKAAGKLKKDEKLCPPVPLLSERWIIAADDNTPAFRIAKALAGLRGSDKIPLPLRAQLFPIHPRSGDWMCDARKEKGADQDPLCRIRLCDGRQGQLVDILPMLLQRRHWLAERLAMSDKPLDSSAGATLDDIAAFLRDDSMDARISDLLPGVALCDIPEDIDRSSGSGVVPAAFALMKLALTPECTLHSLKVLTDGQHLPVPTGMLAQLAAGNHDNRAVTAAWRRLRASGMSPLFSPGALPTLVGINQKRAAAALLIPLRFGATAALARAVLRQSETESV